MKSILYIELIYTTDYVGLLRLLRAATLATSFAATLATTLATSFASGYFVCFGLLRLLLRFL